MFDIKWIRENPEIFDEAMHKRAHDARAADLISLDDGRRSIVLQMNELQEKRNSISKQIGQAKAAGDEEKAQAILAEVGSLKSQVQELEDQEREKSENLQTALLELPNQLHEDVPLGADENDNVEFRKSGAPRQANFELKEHFEVAAAAQDMDFETAAKIAGSRFVVLRNNIARLERALGQFMLDVHVQEHGYAEVAAPLLVRPEALYGTGQLPKFSEDAFETTDGRWLIPTSEVSLTNLVRESTLSEEDLPVRVTSLTPCFRSEAGSAGRDTRGMLRQHQFQKVEMVAVTTPENGEQEQYRILDNAQDILDRLNLPYRVVKLCSGDMGSTMMRTFDIEVWLPGQNAYREISSVSWAGDWQARRMNARFRNGEGQVEFVHTLNGSGIAVGRALIAVIENYQNEDGSITIPEVLVPYLGGMETISVR